MKIKLVIELSEENMEILKSGDISEFDDVCELLSSLQATVQLGEFEEL
jgi:hypothetical protein